MVAPLSPMPIGLVGLWCQQGIGLATNMRLVWVGWSRGFGMHCRSRGRRSQPVCFGVGAGWGERISPLLPMNHPFILIAPQDTRTILHRTPRSANE